MPWYLDGYTQAVANHLWQSTLFALAVWLLAMVLRANSAALRYKLWLAASLKFLMPFALLVATGRLFELPAGPAPAAVVRPVSDIVSGLGGPFSGQALPHQAAPAGVLPLLAAAAWLCGFLVSATAWVLRWRQVRASVRGASAVRTGLPVPVLLTRGRLEPGVAGIFRPVLLLPEGITGKLAPAQLAAVLAHEMCHIRRRDNLCVALHALVESVFWFHPLVWWIGRRLLEERERACDEEVLRAGSAPEDYAEGILRVCRFYLESPACASGTTGADLTRRIQEIMSPRLVRKLTAGKRLLVAFATLLSVAAPLAIGILHAPAMRAQNDTGARFDVASLKSNKSADMREMNFQTQPGGRLTATGVPLYLIIEWAYGLSVQSVRISGGPEWTRSERYDIDARPAPGAIPSDLPGPVREERVRPMLRALLADRFHLVVRTEHKEIPVYVITVAKGGLKMEKSTVNEKDCGPDLPCHHFNGGQGRGVHGKNVSIGDLIKFVENWSDRPLVDRSDLPGLYNMDTDGWVPLRLAVGSGEGFDDPTRLTLFTAFERQLGLKLENAKAPVETFVIESVERPTEN